MNSALSFQPLASGCWFEKFGNPGIDGTAVVGDTGASQDLIVQVDQSSPFFWDQAVKFENIARVELVGGPGLGRQVQWRQRR